MANRIRVSTRALAYESWRTGFIDKTSALNVLISCPKDSAEITQTGNQEYYQN